MKIIGLTGGMGSGKSYVASIFSKKGIPVYNSDIRAKELMVNDSSITESLKNVFGSSVIVENQLNKKLISDSIFNDPTMLEWINNLVHPAVKNDFVNWCILNNTALFVIKEAAILIESKAYKQCDKIIVVTAPLELRVKRIMDRDNLTKEQVMARIKNQISDEERQKYSSFTVLNDETSPVENQIEEIYQKLLYL